MGRQGRIVVPVELRELLGFKEGDRLVARVVDGELRILTFRANLRRIQREIQSEKPADRDLMAEFYAERRRDAAMENDAP